MISLDAAMEFADNHMDENKKANSGDRAFGPRAVCQDIPQVTE